MIEQERKAGSEKITHWKELRLVTPETAKQLGIDSETPVFISPKVRNLQTCSECHSGFGPLVYQVSYEIRSHHFHPDKGGIYFFTTDDNKAGVSVVPVKLGRFALKFPQRFRDIRWEAEVEPIGRVSPADRWFEGTHRSESVELRGIRARCFVDLFELREGELGKIRYDDGTESLFPLCSERHSGYLNPSDFNFIIVEDGQMLFSQT